MNVLQEAGPLNCTKKNIDINFDLGFQVLGWILKGLYIPLKKHYGRIIEGL